MSQSLSNLPISHPIMPERASIVSKSFCPRFLHLPTPISWRIPSTRIRAMATEGRDNLDHLQRVSNKNQAQQPRKRSAPVAPVGLWDRFPTARTVQQMMETMDSLMEDPFVYNGRWQSPVGAESAGGYSRGRTPWEIKESEGEYKMRFDMPGMTKEDVKVWVEDKMLVLKAEKMPKKKDANEQQDEEQEEEEWSAKSYGRYNCRIALPENVQFEKIKAEVKDGVLYITIPKASRLGKVLDINVE